MKMSRGEVLLAGFVLVSMPVLLFVYYSWSMHLFGK